MSDELRRKQEAVDGIVKRVFGPIAHPPDGDGASNRALRAAGLRGRAGDRQESAARRLHDQQNRRHARKSTLASSDATFRDHALIIIMLNRSIDLCRTGSCRRRCRSPSADCVAPTSRSSCKSTRPLSHQNSTAPSICSLASNLRAGTELKGCYDFLYIVGPWGD